MEQAEQNKTRYKRTRQVEAETHFREMKGIRKGSEEGEAKDYNKQSYKTWQLKTWCIW